MGSARIAQGLVLVVSTACQGSRWTETGSMATVRSSHQAVLLETGEVLVVGGSVSPGGPTASAELYDRGTATWTATGSLQVPRTGHTATLLESGEVLVAGGFPEEMGTLATAELYDPTTGAWRPTGSLQVARGGHTAVRLADGSVVVLLGETVIPPHGVERTTVVERYDPVLETWGVIGSLPDAVRLDTAVLLDSGQILLLGDGDTMPNVLFDPATGETVPAPPFVSRRGFQTYAVTRLQTGEVLIAGGEYQGKMASSEVYEPSSGEWRAVGPMTEPRARGLRTEVLLPGDVLLMDQDGSCELFEPSSGRWSPTDGMRVARMQSTATLLTSGEVLVAGGLHRESDQSTTPLSSAELYRPERGE